MERSEAKPESADGGASDGRVPLRDHIRDILDSLPAGVLTVDMSVGFLNASEDP